MATTCKLIAKTTLSTTAASISVQNIPATFTDLYVQFSGRSDYTGGSNGGNTDSVIRLNNDSGANYSYRILYSYETTVGSYQSTGGTSAEYTYQVLGPMPTNNTTYNTASTFSSAEIYIPNYAGSTNKTVSTSNVREVNLTTGDIRIGSGLWSSSSAINRLDILAGYPGGSFVSGTSIYVYGITKA